MNWSCVPGDAAERREMSLKVAYKVSVSNLQCFVYAIADLTRSSLPGAISQLTVAEYSLASATSIQMLLSG